MSGQVKLAIAWKVERGGGSLRQLRRNVKADTGNVGEGETDLISDPEWEKCPVLRPRFKDWAWSLETGFLGPPCSCQHPCATIQAPNKSGSVLSLC